VQFGVDRADIEEIDQHSLYERPRARNGEKNFELAVNANSQTRMKVKGPIKKDRDISIVFVFAQARYILFVKIHSGRMSEPAPKDEKRRTRSFLATWRNKTHRARRKRKRKLCCSRSGLFLAAIRFSPQRDK